jgi:hypothetical protein
MKHTTKRGTATFGPCGAFGGCALTFDKKMIENFIGVAGLLAMVWLYHLMPSLLVSLPIWIWGRHRTTWLWSDFATAVLPFVVWSVLFVLDESGKTLANFGEGLWLGKRPANPVWLR